MKDLFGQLGEGIQGATDAFNNQPTFGLANMLMLYGTPKEEAFVKAAQIQQGQEKNDIQQNKIQQQQQQSMMAAQILQQGGGLAEMLAAGITNPAILGSLPQPQWVPSGDMPGGGSFRTPGMPGMGGMMPQGGGGMGGMMPQGGGGMGGEMPGPQGNQMPMGGPQQPPMNAPQTPPPTRKTPNEMEQERKKELADQRSSLKINERKTAETDKWLSDLHSSAELSDSKIAKLNEIMQELPELLYTGPGANQVQFLNQFTGSKSAASFENFKKATNELVLDIAQTQAGSQSNSDMKRIESTKPDATNTLLGNKRIAESALAMEKRHQEYVEAANEFVNRGGTRAEFRKQWKRYAEANPITSVDKKTGDLLVNEENITNWREKLFGEKEQTTTQENQITQSESKTFTPEQLKSMSYEEKLKYALDNGKL